jgi:hypothetical protein
MENNLIKSLQEEILRGELTPQRASEILVHISALLGNLNDDIRKADITFNRILLDCYNKETKANRAKILAETTPEFEAKRIARDTKDLAIELIRSLKYLIKSQGQEYRDGNFD